MKSINKATDNMGGVIRMWAVPPGDITVAGKTVTVISDVNIIAITVKEDSASFSETPKETFPGTAFKTDVSAVVPCDTPDTQAVIKEMERTLKYLVMYEDGNGNFKLAGSKDVPLKFSAKQSTGTGAAALNNYDITFAGDQRERAVFVDNPF